MALLSQTACPAEVSARSSSWQELRTATGSLLLSAFLASFTRAVMRCLSSLLSFFITVSAW